MDKNLKKTVQETTRLTLGDSVCNSFFLFFFGGEGEINTAQYFMGLARIFLRKCKILHARNFRPCVQKLHTALWEKYTNNNNREQAIRKNKGINLFYSRLSLGQVKH